MCLSTVSESQEDLVREMAAGSESMPAVKHYEQKEFSGMFEYSKDDELIIVKKLILGQHSSLSHVQGYTDRNLTYLMSEQR